MVSSHCQEAGILAIQQLQYTVRYSTVKFPSLRSDQRVTIARLALSHSLGAWPNTAFLLRSSTKVSLISFWYVKKTLFGPSSSLRWPSASQYCIRIRPTLCSSSRVRHGEWSRSGSRSDTCTGPHVARPLHLLSLTSCILPLQVHNIRHHQSCHRVIANRKCRTTYDQMSPYEKAEP